jgi:acyl-CoA reductase-like NAD-dependent aldehyde dehydrogenase
MKMYVNREWVHGGKSSEVLSPYSGEVVDTVPDATPEQVEKCLAAAEAGAVQMAKLTAYERYQILFKAADIISTRVEDFARTVSLEEGKPLSESRGEASRMPDLLRQCALEG